MRKLVNEIILRCGAMSPETAETVRSYMRVLVMHAYLEGFGDGDGARLPDPDAEYEAWRNSVARKAFLGTHEELET